MLLRFEVIKIVIKSLFPILYLKKKKRLREHLFTIRGGGGGVKMLGSLSFFMRLIMIRDGFRCFSQERRRKSKKAWTNSFSNVFSTDSSCVDPN